MKSSPSFAPVRRRSIEDEVYQRLREAILAGELAGGERLVHEDLANRFGISRIPVRDALKRLVADGLVDLDERRIYRVSRCGIEDVEEIYSLRSLLESHAVALATARLEDDDLAALARLQEEMEEAAATRDAETFVERNQAFHRGLYECAGQPRLLRMIEGLWQGLPPLTPLTIESRLAKSNQEHRAIVDALRARDTAGAVEALRAHIAAAGHALRIYVSSRGDRLR
jgi:DNA-binding GntR family transcriptional regulator